MAIFPTVAADADAFKTALAGVQQGSSSFWNGLLVATAARAGCAYLLSKNMQHGARVDGVTILDPFSGEELPDRVVQLLRWALTRRKRQPARRSAMMLTS